MATYTAQNGYTSSSSLFELNVLLDGSITLQVADGTQVTYGNDPFLPGYSIILTGTGMSGSPSASWNITDIEADNDNAVTAIDWQISGITGVDGAPASTSGSFDPTSIFQAALFHNAARLIFRGHDNLLEGGPGPEALIAWGIEGSHETVRGGSGYEVISGNGGINTLFAGTGQDFFLFNFLDSHNPTANVSTIHGFNVAKDRIELDSFVFGPLAGTPELLAGEFKRGHPAGHYAQIVYNQHNGNLYFDPNGVGAPHFLFATVFSGGHHHPWLTAADFFVI